VPTFGEEALREAAARLAPGARVVALVPLADDAAGAGVARKAIGYGRGVRVELLEADGSRRDLVFHAPRSDGFGHERRADRVASMLLAFDTARLVPGQVHPVDVGLSTPGGLRSLRDAGEPYLVTAWAPGRLYAEDLRRVARLGRLGEHDLARCLALARHLVALHAEPLSDPAAWRRAQRDLLGGGEGVFGVADAYGGDVPGAPAARLLALEQRLLAWRWRARGRAERLRRTHGDFHPFNIVFSEGTRFALLDASRGCAGDPADDVTALSVNYLFFALQAPAAWRGGFGRLWRTFWEAYLEGAGTAVLELAAPWLAWRALVLACPAFYPDLAPPAREALLGLAERALDAGPFDPDRAEELFP
jgi:aminoglycoside phosphotransferase (APT) family kinase protein